VSLVNDACVSRIFRRASPVARDPVEGRERRTAARSVERATVRLQVMIAVALAALGVVGTQVIRVQRVCTTALPARAHGVQAKTTTCEWRIKHT